MMGVLQSQDEVNLTREIDRISHHMFERYGAFQFNHSIWKHIVVVSKVIGVSFKSKAMNGGFADEEGDVDDEETDDEDDRKPKLYQQSAQLLDALKKANKFVSSQEANLKESFQKEFRTMFNTLLEKAGALNLGVTPQLCTNVLDLLDAGDPARSAVRDAVAQISETPSHPMSPVARLQDALITIAQHQKPSPTIIETIPWHLNPAKLQLWDRLDYGVYGVVRSGRYDGIHVVARELSSDLDMRTLEHDCHMNYEVSDPRLARVLGVAIAPSNGVNVVMLVSEKIESKSLFSALHHHRATLTLAEKFQVLIDVAEALQVLHNRTPPLAHMALSSKKVHLRNGNRAVLRDAMLSCLASQQKRSALPFMAPETLLDDPLFGTPSDVYSFAILIIELLREVNTHNPNSPRAPLLPDGIDGWLDAQATNSTPTRPSSNPSTPAAVLTIKRAESLKDADMFGKSDPFAVLKTVPPSGKGRTVGQTSTVSNTMDPTWDAKFDLTADDVQHALRIDLFDDDAMGKDAIGWCSISISDLIKQAAKSTSSSHDVTCHVQDGKGRVYVNVSVPQPSPTPTTVGGGSTKQAKLQPSNNALSETLKLCLLPNPDRRPKVGIVLDVLRSVANSRNTSK